MMKRLLLGLMLLVTATAANAEWTVDGESANFIQYVDRATIRRNGNFAKMWSLVDYKRAQLSGGTYDLSFRSQHEYDCNEEKRRLLALTTFSGQMGSGTVNFTSNDSKQWAAVAPGSMAESLWKIACGKE